MSDAATTLSLLTDLRQRLVSLGDADLFLQIRTRKMIDSLESRVAADSASAKLPEQVAAAIVNAVGEPWCILAANSYYAPPNRLWAEFSFRTQTSASTIVTSNELYTAIVASNELYKAIKPSVDGDSIGWLTSVATAVRDAYKAAWPSAERVLVDGTPVNNSPDCVKITVSVVTPSP